jgi:hypothetical protein
MRSCRCSNLDLAGSKNPSGQHKGPLGNVRYIERGRSPIPIAAHCRVTAGSRLPQHN